jgi:HAD superfamily hydrolase (TIGR01509 family)
MKLLQYLEIIGVKKVVVTSTAQQTALRWLKNTNILRFFYFVLGGDQVQNGKPHPEIYLTACRRLKVESANCLALEDSDNGVLSATNAGLVVIQIPDLIQPSTEVRALGHRIVKSLAEVEAILKEH